MTPANRTVKAVEPKLESKVDKILDMLHAEEKSKSQREVFNCLICRETASSVMLSGSTGCGQFLGCFSCLFHISNCPNCRATFPCVTEQKPLIIPGLAQFLDVPDISLKSALKQAGAIPTDDTSDSDLEEVSRPLSSVICDRRVATPETNAAARGATDGSALPDDS